MLPLGYGAVIVLLVMPAVPPPEFGKFNLVFGVFSFIAVFNRAVILSPMLRRASAPGDFGTAARAGLALSAGFNLAAAAVVVGMAPWAAQVLRLSPAESRLAAVLAAAFFFRDYIFHLLQTRYQTGRIFAVEAVFYVGAGSLTAAGAHLGGLTSGADLIGAVAAAATLSSLTGLALGPVGEIARARFSLGAAAEIARYGRRTLSAGIAGGFLQSADVLAIGAVFTPAEVAVYSGAKWVYRAVSALAQAGAMLVTPYAARLRAEGRVAELRELVEKSTAYVTTGLAVFAGLLAAGAGVFYRLPPLEAYTSSAPVLRLLAVAAPAEGLFQCAGGILYGMGAAGWVVGASVGTLATSAAALSAFTLWWGPLGTAAAVVLTMYLGAGLAAAGVCRTTGATPGSIAARLANNLRRPFPDA